MLAPGSMGGSPCSSASQSVLDLRLLSTEEESSRTQAVIGLLVRFVTGIPWLFFSGGLNLNLKLGLLRSLPFSIKC